MPMSSLWTQLEKSTGPSVPLVAALLVPNVESKADLLSPCRNLDFSLHFRTFFVLPKSAFDGSSSSLRCLCVFMLHKTRPKQQKSSLAASVRTACCVQALNVHNCCACLQPHSMSDRKQSLEWNHSRGRLGAHPLSAEFQEFTPDPN